MRNAVIAGGGIVGLATAYKILENWPDISVTVLEKEPAVGQHQTGNNSGVLHSGLYYKPGSSKARLAVSGIRQMVRFCAENGVPHEICGKVVVATTPEELPRLHDLFARGHQNGLAGLKMLNAGEIHEIEPHAAGIAAIHVPQEGIADYPKACEALVRNIARKGSKVVLNAAVRKAKLVQGSWVVETNAGEFRAGMFINCAGLHADRVAALAGEARQTRIVPFRGEYYKIRPERQHLVRNLIYPVPDPRFPFLGVHFTRLIRGGVEAGPNAVLALAREGYRWSNISLPDIWDSLSYPGLWRFLRKYPSMCWHEVRRSFSKALFCRSLQRLVPEITAGDLIPGGAGVRAQALSPEGELIQDFHFIVGRNALHVLNAPSPAATAALAIGEEIVNRLASAFGRDVPAASVH